MFKNPLDYIRSNIEVNKLERENILMQLKQFTEQVKYVPIDHPIVDNINRLKVELKDIDSYLLKLKSDFLEIEQILHNGRGFDIEEII